MSKLDPYSSYISPEEMAQFSEAVDQEFGGIGIQIHPDERDPPLTVMSPLPGTPAYRAGLVAGDTIIDDRRQVDEGLDGGQGRSDPQGQAGRRR